MGRKAKIIATIGPASDGEETLERLIKAGVNVARLNFSHGSHEIHAARIAAIRAIAEHLGNPVGILQDLQGPKIRVGVLDAPIQLEVGEQVTLYTEEDPPPKGSGYKIPVDFRQLFEAVHKGDRLLLDDGRLTLSVQSASKRALKAVVKVGGLLTSNKGINLPGVQLRISGYTKKDEKDLAFGITHEVDAVAVSFVRTARGVKRVREAMQRFSKGKPLPLLIAKLERPEALENLDEILDIVDGVMVARGDLGVEMPPERVPVLQKFIIQKANAKAKLVITATQMLESMILNPLPTRAEASDVANAIFDGTDAVMLSAETASGQHPLEAVGLMNRIICEAESHFLEWGTQMDNVLDLGESDAAYMARASHALAHDRDVTALAAFTMQGRTAWLMSKVRPSKQILAFTPEITTYRKLAFLWGVQPQIAPFVNNLETMIQYVDEELMRTGIKPGQQVVVVCGFPVGAKGAPNMALLHTVGERT
jgi:pyruvate kinase